MFGRKFISRIVALSIALMCCAAVATGLTIWRLRADAIEQAKEGAGNIATVIARQANYSVRTFDLVLDEVLARVGETAPRTQEEFSQLLARRDLHDFLVGRLAKLPQAEVINITDGRGRILASTRDFPAPNIDVSDRDTFRHFSENSDDGLFLGVPVFSKATGKWSMFFSRRVLSSTGAFLGVALVGAQPSKFMQLYDAIGSIAGASALLLRGDGTVYLRHPDGIERAGEKLPANSEWYSVIAAGGGYFRSPGVFDLESRWVAARPVDQYPLVVNIAISENSALAVWRERATVIILGALLALAVMAALLRLIFIGYRKTLESEALLTEREGRLEQKSIELSVANIRFDTALTHMRQALAMYDAQDRIVIHNRGYAELYGLTSDQMPPGTPLSRILELRIANGMYTKAGPDDYVRRHRGHFDDRSVEIEQMRDGRYILVTHQKMPGGGWVTTHEDITERQRTVAQMAHMAHHDPLTNLANRSLFLDHLEKLGGDRAANGGFAVMLLDLDQFKAVNDTHGHIAGDALLWAVAARIQQSLGPGDLCARLGGDEFAIAAALSMTRGALDIERFASRLVTTIREPYLIEERDLTIGVSIGIAICEGQSEAPVEIMRFADIAMYKAKAEGRNCYRMFDPSMEAETRERRQLAFDLEAALVNQKLEVHYQPVVDCATLEVRGMEALARWNHPTRGNVPPMSFIALAEEAGHIHRLGDFVLNRACRDAAAWPAAVKVAVNVSPLQLAADDFVHKVRRALAISGLPAARLELEITESVLLDNNARNLAVLHQLRELGVAIVLDDFGTGFSSLSYLNRFPFDKIKIDKSFIDGLGVDAGSSAIVCATTSIARALHAVTTAEGVETQEQSDLLRAASVTQLQGYFYGKPRPATEWAFAEGQAVLRINPSAEARAA